LQSVLDAILAQLHRVVDYDSASIMLIEGDAVRTIAGRGFPPELILDALVLPSTDGKIIQMRGTRQPMVIDDVRSDPHWAPLKGTEYIRSWIGAPLLAQQQMIGVLNIDKAQPGYYQQEDAQLVLAFANQAAVVIENARLLDRERQRASQLSVLSDLGRHVLSILDPEALLEFAAQAIQQQFGYYCVDIFLTDPAGEYLVFRAGSHSEYASQWRKSRMRFRIGEEGITGHVAATGQARLVNALQSDSHYIADELLTEVQSELAVPIKVGTRVIGVLDLNSDQPKAFDDDDLFVAQSLADQLALGLENARLYEAANQRVAELEAIRKASLSLTSSLELQEVLDAILENTLSLLGGVQDTHIFLHQDGQLAFGAALWADGRRGEPWAELRPEGLTYTIARRGEPIFVPDMRTHPLFADAPPNWTGSIVGLPLKIGQRVVGVMTVAYQEPRTLPETERRILRLLADQAAIAIENARLFSTEQKRHQELQSIQATATALSAELHLETLLSQIVTEAARAFNAQALDLMLWDERETARDVALEIRASHGLSDAYADQQRIPEAALAGILTSGHTSPHYLADVTEASFGDRNLVEQEGLLGALVIPMVSHGHLAGLLNVYSREEPRFFTPAEIELADAFAAQAAAMIANARLYQQAEHDARELADRAERLAMVNRISVAINSTLDLDQVLSTASREMALALGIKQCGIVLLDREAGYATVAAEFQESPDDTAEMVRIPLTGNPSLERVMATQKPLAITDARNDPLAANIRDVVMERNIQSLLIVPIVVKDQVIGTIGLDAIDTPRRFTPEEVDLAQTIANQVGLAVENARLYEETQQRLKQLALLFDTSASISTSLNVGRVIETLAEQITLALDAEGCTLYRWDRDRNQIETLLDYSMDLDWWQPEPTGSLYELADYPATRKVLTNRQPRLVHVTDPAADPADVAWIKAEDAQSYLMVPMVVRDEAIGLLEIITCSQKRMFTVTEINLCQTLANQAAAAFENARLFRQAETRAREMSALAAVGRAMNTLDLHEVLNSIAENALVAVQSGISSVYLLDEDQRTLRPWSVRGMAHAELEQALFKLGEGTIGLVAQSGEAVIVNDTATDPRFVVKTEASRQITHTLTVPLAVKDVVIGTLEVCNKIGESGFTATDQRLLTTFAAQAAVAIENARLYEEVSQHLEEVRFLNRAAAAATSTLDLTQALRRSLDALLGMRDFERVHVLLIDPASDDLWLHPALADSGVFSQQARFRVPLGQGIIGSVAQTGETIRVADVRQEPRYQAGYEDTLSELCVPLRVGDRIIGVLDVQSSRLDAFSESDERLLTTLASQLSTVIDNARLFDETQVRVRELTALTEASMALNEAEDLDTVLNVVLEQALGLLGSREGSVILIDPPDGDTLRIVAERGLGPEIVEEFNRRPVYAHEGTYRRSLSEGRMVEVADTSSDPDFLHDVGSRAQQVTNIPLIAERGAIGLIAAEGVPPDDTTRRLLTALADMAAVAIDKERLHQETADRLAEVSTLYTLSTQITSSLSLTPVLESIVNILKITLDCRACSIFLIDPTAEYLSLQAGSGMDKRWKGAARLRIGEGVSGQVIEEQRSIYVPDTHKEPEFIFFDPNIRSLLVVPLIARDKVIGTLSIDDIKPNAFDKEVRLLTIAAAQASAAIESAQLYESLQRSYGELEQAYNELRQLDKLKSEFVQNISHELRTPLTFIKGYVELLVDGDMGDLSEEQEMALDIVMNKAEALSRLVDDIISLQQAERERQRFETFSLAELGHAAVRSALVSAAELEIALRDDIPDELPMVSGDRQRVGQIFDNMLQNALKFSNPGDTITVRMKLQGTFILTEVQDTGIGIPGEQLDRIFDRFYQVDGTTTRRFGGTGLGLAIVKQIVENHGGQVGVESALGEGSTFFFTIPIAAGG
jgi:GAF domain-containing protein